MKSAIYILCLAAPLFSLPAFADMDIPVKKVTAYSGNCAHDHYGGGTTASNGEKVALHTVENPGGGYAIAAVPQARSQTAGIFKCFFRDQQNYPGILFKAADHYGKGSNGLEKYDASHQCRRDLTSMSKPATMIVVQGSCGGVRGGAGDTITRTAHHARRHKRRA
jgi:hypothetical protein